MTTIITFSNREKHLKELKQLDKKKIFTYGHFTSIHPGHIRYLQNARSFGDILIVVIKGDQKKDISQKYPFSIKDRSKSIAMLNICDYIINLKNEELFEVVKAVLPEVLVFGTDYKNDLKKEIRDSINFARKKKIEVIYNSGKINYATTEFLRDSKTKIDISRRKIFFESCNKQVIKTESLKELLFKIKKIPILIIGDSIIDEYTGCEALGMSAEAPVIVLKELKSKVYIGGAGIVASHINSLGGECFFVSITGNDHYADFLEKELDNRNIKHSIFRDKNRITTYKKRYMVENQKLFRVSKLDEKPIDTNLENKLMKEISNIIPKVKGIIFSDFNYGVVSENIIKKVTTLAKSKGIKIFSDSQSSTQLCSITKFKDCTLLCPNEKEARVSLQNNFSGLESLVNEIFKISNPEKLIMKLGGQGFIAYEKEESGRVLNQYFPALSSNPSDVTGAGDALLAFMSLALAAEVNFMEASALSCFIGMLAVESVGNNPITTNQLLLRIKQYLKN